MDLTSEPGPPSKKTTKEPTLEPKSVASLYPSMPLRGYSMGYLALGDIGRYQKGADQPRFATLEERIKEASWGDTFNNRILGQEDTLESV